MMRFFDAAKLRQHRQEQAAQGFPLLRGCPNTSAIGLIIFLDSLPQAERQSFATQLSDMEEALDARPPQTHSDMLGTMQRFTLVTRHFGTSQGLHPPQATPRDVRQIPVKVMAALLKDAGGGGLDAIGKTLLLSGDAAARSPSPDHAATLDEAVPVAPARLRKLVGQLLTDTFGAVPQAISKDHTVYDLTGATAAIRLHAMFAAPGRMRQQLDYRLEIRQPGGGQAAYESIWRTPGSWDYLTEANAGRSITHLATLIGQCLALR